MHEMNNEDRKPSTVGGFFFAKLQFSLVRRCPENGRKNEKKVGKYGPMNPLRKAAAELAIKSNPIFIFIFHTRHRNCFLGL